MKLFGIDWAKRPGQHQFYLEGRYVMKHRRNNKPYRIYKGKNLVTDVGENLVAGLVDPDQSLVGPQYMALGSGTSLASKSQTVLEAEIAGSRVQRTGTAVQSTNTLALTFDHTSVGVWNMREAGIFNATPAGTMFSRFLTQAVDLADGDTLETTWTLTFSGVD